MILKPLWGTPSDEEIMGIHAVILVANKVIDAKYQSRASGAIFPDLTIYTPPTLPAHVTVDLNAVLGAPSEEEIIKVRSAIRSYHQFANVPSIFDPRVDMKLSQHLFDIQMAGYIHRASQSQATPKLREASSSSTTVEPQRMPTGESLVVTDNAGIGATTAEPHESTRTVHGVSIQEAIERSNRLAEQTNKLIERSNQIAERANQLVEQSSHSEERSNKLAERSNELFGRLNQHLEESNRLARESTRPVENLGDVLMNINRVLVRIQHVIVRSHKGNTLSALGFLVNEKGETPETSRTTQNVSRLPVYRLQKFDG